jgi:hypothetical protein
METIKPLSELTEPDRRHNYVVVIDPAAPGHRRPLTLEDQYSKIAHLELSGDVPEAVRSAFSVASMLWIHGWFYWPFYTLSSLHAYLCLDMALAIRIAKADGITDPRWHTPSLTKMLERAINERWIVDDGIAHARRAKERAKQEIEAWPEEWRDKLAPNPWEESDQRYCEILLDVIPKLRNALAHPNSYWHDGYGSPVLDLENVHGMIQQLFPSAEE